MTDGDWDSALERVPLALAVDVCVVDGVTLTVNNTVTDSEGEAVGFDAGD